MELLVVMLILALLIAMLLPAINGALRAAKTAAVGGELNQLSQALAAFKNQYGDYPPSRILLIESGDYSAFMGNAALTSGSNSTGAGDINLGQLAVRSVSALRKFFPRVVLNTTSGGGATGWYDFNGDGLGNPTSGSTQGYILQGHECLVFFLGGIPESTASGFGMTGFCKNPANPFVSVNGTGGGNRQPPFFQFVGSRLFADSSNPYAGVVVGKLTLSLPQIPGYLDTLGNASPTFNPGDPINFYAYFSAYGNSGYDPNDVNFFSENHDPTSKTSPELQYAVNFPVTQPKTGTVSCTSYAPNPYTSSFTLTTSPTVFQSPQSFQIISSGIDGIYGVGGQYSPDLSEALPYDQANNPYVNNSMSSGLRNVERDNITTFHNGRLE